MLLASDSAPSARRAVYISVVGFGFCLLLTALTALSGCLPSPLGTGGGNAGPDTCANDAYEPNDEADSATPISGDITAMGCGGEFDHYALTLERFYYMELRVEFEPGYDVLMPELFDSEGLNSAHAQFLWDTDAVDIIWSPFSCPPPDDAEPAEGTLRIANLGPGHASYSIEIENLPVCDE